jgi:hypothetical protein
VVTDRMLEMFRSPRKAGAGTGKKENPGG